MLAPLDNGTIFKKAFTDKIVFEQFIEDIFDKKVSVDKIETEKSFYPKKGNIDFKLDIYAETVDKRFIIEIQRIDYDYNFDRFLHYFLNVITEQQRTAKKYKMQQDVLAVVVLTRPYVLDQVTGEPIEDNVMTLDFDLENLKGKKIRIWEHNIVFLNPHPKYNNKNTPAKYQDWLDLFQNSIEEKVDYTLNLNNSGIKQAVNLIDYENISPQELQEAKITASKKAMRMLLESRRKKETDEFKKEMSRLKNEKNKFEKEADRLKKETDRLREEKNKFEEEKNKFEEETGKLRKELDENRKKGTDKNLINSARLMKSLGATTEQIQKATGLYEKEIDEL